MNIDTARKATEILRQIDAIALIGERYNQAVKAKSVIVSVRVLDGDTGIETLLPMPAGIMDASLLTEHVDDMQRRLFDLMAELEAL